MPLSLNAPGKTITLKAANSRKAILKGSSSNRVITATAGTFILVGLVLTEGQDSLGGGMVVSGTAIDVTLDDCSVEDNAGGAASLDFGGGSALASTRIDHCPASGRRSAFTRRPLTLLHCSIALPPVPL